MNQYESGPSVTIRARSRSYFILGGIWILVAVLCLLLNIRIPEEGFRVIAIFAAVFAVVWWTWLQRIRLTVSGGYLEYRGGIFRLSRTALKGIGEIRSENTEADSPVPARLPRVMVITKRGDISMVIDPRPFNRDDLDRVMQILRRK